MFLHEHYIRKKNILHFLAYSQNRTKKNFHFLQTQDEMCFFWYEGHITDDDRICDKIAAVLNVPEEYDVVCILPVGKAKDDFHAPSKKPLAERVRFNRWSQ